MTDETRIYDNTDTFHWSQKIDVSYYDHGDIILSKDPQERLGEDTIAVVVIDRDIVDPVRHLGLFWSKEEARKYAESIREYNPVLNGNKDQ